jgi:hypothetical protein
LTNPAYPVGPYRFRNREYLIVTCVLLALFPPIHGKIERGDPLLIAGPLEHLGMAQRAHRIVIAGAPMLLHGQPENS